MEYGRLVVLGYSSYRVASTTRPAKNQPLPTPSSSRDGRDTDVDVARSPQGVIGASALTGTKSEKDRRTIGQLWEPIGDQNAEYVLVKRKSGNGVQLHRYHHFLDGRLRDRPTDAGAVSAVGKADLKTVTRRMMHAIEIRSKALQRSASASHLSSDDSEVALSPSSASSSSSASSVSSTGHSHPHQPLAVPSQALPFSAVTSPYLLCVPMNDADAHASVTEYIADDTTDMFQIGRMPCRQNDVVIPGPRVGASGTISRFAARILCRREAPYECRLYAGGFDVGRKMTTAGHALKRCSGCAEWLKRLPTDHKCVRTLMNDEASDSSDTDDDNQREQPKTDKRRPTEPQQMDASAVTSGMVDLDHVELEMDDPARVPVDGLTKNGVRVWLPDQKKWYEVSVNGNLYAIAPRTPSVSSLTGRHATVNPDTSVRHSAFNRPTGGVADVPALLTDGAIIDLGGVQLQFQAPRRNQHSAVDSSVLRASMLCVDDLMQRASESNDSSMASKMDKLNVHCPVQLHPLRFDRGSSEEEIDVDQVPHVFPACGHVFGFEKRIARSKMCPLCRAPGNFVRLLLKENFQLMPRAERTAVPECVFNPCGHAISSNLAAHYAGLVMPNGRAICPFCAVHLDAKTPFSRLYLYSENDAQDQHASTC